MAELIELGTEKTPNRVEFYRRKRWYVANFDDPGEAYRFWLSLKRGVSALLYQKGKLEGRGNGLESN